MENFIMGAGFYQGKIPSEAEKDQIKQRMPSKPYCTDDLQHGLRIRPKETALKKELAQFNPPWMRAFLLFDVDYVGAVLAWEQGKNPDLPEPSWIAINPENKHAHYSWILDVPVLVSNSSRREPIRYLVAIEAAYRDALGADEGYSGLITKNPFHSRWDVLGTFKLYDLETLADHVDLKKYKLKRGVNPEPIGLGRNCLVFEFLRRKAYKEVLSWKAAKTQHVFPQWQNYLYHQALRFNGDFPKPMDSKECWHIARSVSRWVWNKFSEGDRSDWAARKGRAGGKKARNQHEAGALGGKKATNQHEAGAIGGKMAKNQREAGRASGEVRATQNEDKRASARLMRAKGMSFREIGKTLGVNHQTVKNWTSDE